MALTHGGDIFRVAEDHGWDWREIGDFSASINALGPAPGVASAICRAVERIVHYPDRNTTELRRALSCAWNIAEDQIMPGNGATELIFFLARMFATRPVSLATPVFQEFHRAFPGAALVHLANSDTWPRNSLVCLTRPANPTGITVPLDFIEERLRSSPEPLLIDESFIEYSAQLSALGLIDRYPQLIVLRSLTKFYALPGVRIGALVASAETLGTWQSHREPWQVSVLAEQAAIAALRDTEHAFQSKTFVTSERAWLLEQLLSISGIHPLASDANYLHIPLDYPASDLVEHMLSYKILVRDCNHWPGLSGEAVRIAVRRRDENERLLNAWKEFRCA
jgi:threonine-phosphate decarboxylase